VTTNLSLHQHGQIANQTHKDRLTVIFGILRRSNRRGLLTHTEAIAYIGKILAAGGPRLQTGGDDE
jgi:hypothetical protein